jgi:hypothetical protein
MRIVIIRRFVRPDREREFLDDYYSKISKHGAFKGETLTRVATDDDLPAGLTNLFAPVEGCITYLNIARWEEWQPFVGHCGVTENDMDPDFEVKPRQRIVLDIIDEIPAAETASDAADDSECAESAPAS